jgi:hypothetical protein
MMNKDIQYYVATALGYSDYDAFFTLLRNKSKFRYLQGVVSRTRGYAICQLYFSFVYIPRSPQGRHGSFVDKEHLKLTRQK